ARQALPGPFCVGYRIIPGYLHHRVLPASFQTTCRALRMLPASARNISPPLVMAPQRYLLGWRCEHQGSGNQVLRGSARKIFSLRLSLCNRLVISGLHKFGELLIGHQGFVQPKSVDMNLMNWLHINKRWLITAHPKGARWNPNHAAVFFELNLLRRALVLRIC